MILQIWLDKRFFFLINFQTVGNSVSMDKILQDQAEIAFTAPLSSRIYTQARLAYEMRRGT